ncbi:MAG: AAA family ATPase [Acidobacteriaceae bacterium]
MIKSFKTENFRCFKKIEISDLRRINVVVGKNAAGKTSLLEALKLGLDGTPNVVPWLDGIRGIPFIIPPNTTNDQFQGAFLDFFHDFDSQSTISTAATDSADKTAHVRVCFDPSAAVTIQPSIGFKVPAGSGAITAPSNSPATTIVPLAFQRIDFKGQHSTLFVTMNPNGQLQMQPGKPLGPVSGFFSGSASGGPQETAGWLSKLRVEKRDKTVVEALRRHFPFINDVTPETMSMGLNMVFADIPTLPRKVPLSLVSGGINRLFTLILAAVSFQGGVVLIDEVETGIYYEQYAEVWKTLYGLSVQCDTQLFISSHSNECLKAMLPTMHEHEEDFRLLRADKKNGISLIHSVDGKYFEAGLDEGFDHR